MRDDISSSATTWQEEELSAATLPDKRLAHRLRRRRCTASLITRASPNMAFLLVISPQLLPA